MEAREGGATTGSDAARALLRMSALVGAVVRERLTPPANPRRRTARPTTSSPELITPRIAPPATNVEQAVEQAGVEQAVDQAAAEPFRHTSRRALTLGQRAQHAVIAVVWLAACAVFWVWWLTRAGHTTPWLYVLYTAALLYQVTVMPTFFWRFVRRMEVPNEVPAPRGPGAPKVALATLCVPSSESMEVIEEQLIALGKVSYPHESWILDEGGLDEVRRLAERYGVRYFSRHGVERWNQPKPPFQAKTKAGNVNAWLDHLTEIGTDYDVFVQFDIDHHPRPDYLDRVLGYFQDDRVAWVQAPSVCGNLDNWTARGLAEQDLVFQGPLQMGFYGATRTPFIIGSHTSYRTEAVRRIGGFQPTRAEDHLDTVVLAAHGYEGVYVPELIAVGDGPEDFRTYLRQQFAWAYSMIQILRFHMPRLIKRYRAAQMVQFLMCQSWYAGWSLSLALLWLLPTLALVFHLPIASVSAGGFLERFLPMAGVSMLMWFWARRWFQPKGVMLSWRSIVLEVARWPAVLWALINVFLKLERDYMVTPKGRAGQKGPSPLGIYGPYLGLALVPALAVLVTALTSPNTIQSYAGVCLLNASLAALLLVTALASDIREKARSLGRWLAVRQRLSIIGLVAVTLGVGGGSAAVAWDPMVGALTWSGGPAQASQAPHATPGSPASPGSPGSSALHGSGAGSTSSLEEAPIGPSAGGTTGVSPALPCTAPRDRSGPVDLGVTTAAMARNWYRAWNETSLRQVNRFEQDAGMHACIVQWFADWAHSEPVPAQLQEAGARGSIPEITWEPWDASAGVDQPRYRLAAIAAGDFDPYVRRWAEALAAYRRPVYLRFAQEMDGIGYPWGVGVDGNTPSQYVAAWRHVWTVFRQAGATNVRWVWTPLTLAHSAAFYPGDRYVDVVGLDAFNDGRHGMWYDPSQLLQGGLSTAQAIAPHKAVQISEVASTERGGDKAEWISRLFAFVRSNQQIRSVVWFNVVKNGDHWPIESSIASSTAFSRAVSGDDFR